MTCYKVLLSLSAFQVVYKLLCKLGHFDPSADEVVVSENVYISDLSTSEKDSFVVSSSVASSEMESLVDEAANRAVSTHMPSMDRLLVLVSSSNLKSTFCSHHRATTTSSSNATLVLLFET